MQTYSSADNPRHVRTKRLSGMHLSSYEHMASLFEKFLSDRKPGTVVDIGSQDVNGSYRPIFEAGKWQYVGVDSTAGANVDLVAKNPYQYPIATNSVDVVISGQAFEHIEYFWLSWLEVVRMVKPKGYIFLIAPSRGPEHRYPVDCWRFYPDGFQALAKWGNVELLKAETDWDPHSDPGSAMWGDTCGVFLKRKQGLRSRFYRTLLMFFARGMTQ